MTNRPDYGSKGPQHPKQESLALEASSPGSPARLAGVVDRVLYHDDESGFSVVRLRVDGRRDLASLVGRNRSCRSRRVGGS